MSEKTINQSEDMRLSELISVLWQGKWLIITITSALTIAAVVLALSLPNKYTSSVLLTPSASAGSDALGGLARQLGGLASLAGINVKDNSISNAALALEVVRSRDFISRFITEHGVLVPLMAVKGWQSHDNTLLFDPQIYENGDWVRDVEPPRKAEPSLQEAYDEFIEHFTVTKSKDNGIVTLTVEHYSPYIAKQWAEALVADLNLYMKRKDMQEAKDSLNYLQDELAKTQIEELRKALYQLIEEQTKILMLTQVNKEYVFKTIDPAVVAEKKSKPNRPLICILGFLLGGFISCFIVLVRHFTHRTVA